jgi:hypothetical protein
MHSFLLIAALPLLSSALDDPAAVFQSCVYVTSLPARGAAVKPEIQFQIEMTDQPGVPLRPDNVFHSGDRITLGVTSQRAGYFYIFQDDPADKQVLMFPDAGNTGNQIANQVVPGRQLARHFKFTSTSSFSLLLAVSPSPVSGAEKMTAAQARQYFNARSRCEGFAILERSFTFPPR